MAAQRGRDKEAFWVALIDEFRMSGLTQSRFAKSKGVPLGTFRYWLYRLRESMPVNELSLTPESARPVFDEVQLKFPNVDLGAVERSVRIAVEKYTSFWVRTSLPTVIEDALPGLVHDLASSNIEGVLQKLVDEKAEDIIEVATARLNNHIYEEEEQGPGEFTLSLMTLASRVDELERVMSRKERPKVLHQIESRIKAAMSAGSRLKNTVFTANISARQLCLELMARNFFISESTAKEIIEGLERRKLLVLEGVPGTGKSDLARHLASIFMPRHEGESFTQVSISPEVGAWHSIGGLRMLNKHFVPHFGWLTEAVLRSTEADGYHWLILDEINRGDVSTFLGPALEMLVPGVPSVLQHPHLFPAEPVQLGEIPVPGYFRIIGTRNPFDADVLYEFPHAFDRRIAVVRIQPLLGSEHESLIEHLALVRCMARLSWAGSSPEEFKLRYNLAYPAKRMLGILGQFSALAGREPRHLYEHCELGTSLAIDCVMETCLRYVRQAPVGELALEIILDDVISAIVLAHLRNFSRQALIALRDEIFGHDWAPACHNKLAQALVA